MSGDVRSPRGQRLIAARKRELAERGASVAEGMDRRVSSIPRAINAGRRVQDDTRDVNAVRERASHARVGYRYFKGRFKPPVT